MNQDLPDQNISLIKEAEAEILSPRHSFDMVIPGEIRWRTDLSKDEQWLYALIRNLCRREGYCWATNDYLSQEATVNPRTIQRYIVNLEKKGIITREIIQHGMKKRRRIFLTTEFKKVIVTTPVSPPSRQPCHDGNDSRVVLPKRDITEEKYSSSSVSPKPTKIEPPPTKEEEEELSRRFKESIRSGSKINHRKKWESTVLLDMRDEEKAERTRLEAIQEKAEERLKAQRIAEMEKIERDEKLRQANIAYIQSLAPSGRARIEVQANGVKLPGEVWGNCYLGYDEPDLIKYIKDHLSLES